MAISMTTPVLFTSSASNLARMPLRSYPIYVRTSSSDMLALSEPASKPLCSPLRTDEATEAVPIFVSQT